MNTTDKNVRKKTATLFHKSTLSNKEATVKDHMMIGDDCQRLDP